MLNKYREREERFAALETNLLLRRRRPPPPPPLLLSRTTSYPRRHVDPPLTCLFTYLSDFFFSLFQPLTAPAGARYLRPLARRFLRTLRPPGVWRRARKPEVRARARRVPRGSVRIRTKAGGGGVFLRFNARSLAVCRRVLEVLNKKNLFI